MQLMDFENSLLLNLQQPGITTFGNPPNFAAIPSPAYGKDRLDYYINRWYQRLLGDVAELELVVVTNSFFSVANSFKYGAPQPFATNPAVAKPLRIQYAPLGMNYTYEYRQGVEWISWNEYQRLYTGQGYDQNFTTATIPGVCAIDITRNSLFFYPGSANSGDTINFIYSPLPKNGSLIPFLSAATDSPAAGLPDDCQDLIVQGALSELWIPSREFQMARQCKANYDEGLLRIKKQYWSRSKGDILSMPYPDYPLSMRDPY